LEPGATSFLLKLIVSFLAAAVLFFTRFRTQIRAFLAKFRFRK
jgi:hypothetical protein